MKRAAAREVLIDARCDRCGFTEEVYGGWPNEYIFLRCDPPLPLIALRRDGWRAWPEPPLLCPTCAKEIPMSKLSDQLTVLEAAAAPLSNLYGQLQLAEDQVAQLKEQVNAAEVAQARLKRVQLYAAYALEDRLDPDQLVNAAIQETIKRAEQKGLLEASTLFEHLFPGASTPAILIQPQVETPSDAPAPPEQSPEVAAEAEVEPPPALPQEVAVPEAERPAPDLTPDLPAAESAPLESAPEQPTEDSAPDTLPPAALPPEPEINLPPEAPAEGEAPDESEEDPELESATARANRQILAWLGAHPGPHAGREIADALGGHPNISNLLTPLFRAGQIQRTGEGGLKAPYQYSLPTSIDEPEQESPTPEPEQAKAPDPQSPPESANVELSQESILTWFQTHSGEHAAQDVADAFQLPLTPAITIRLKKLWEQKELRRFGQGITSDPFRYCLPGEVISTATPPAAPVVTESPKPSARPLQSVAPVQLDPAIKAIHREQVLGELIRSSTLTAKTCAAALKLDQLVAERCLEALCESGDAQRISLIQGENDVRTLGYRLPKVNKESTDSFPVPPQLAQDEVTLFLELRKDFKGKVVHTLMARTQWNLPRLKKALDGLLHAGHIGKWGKDTAATYAVLAPERRW